VAGSLIVEAPDVGAITLKQHVIGLDTVRAYAALSVMFAHILGPKLPTMIGWLGLSKDLAELSRYIFTGHPAVIVFFVVSGFCIHYPYTNRPLPIFAFTLARWTRIMVPALMALLLAKVLHMNKFNFMDGYILWSIVCELCYYTLYPLFLKLSCKVSFEMQLLIAFIISLSLVTYLGSDQHGGANIYGPGLNWLVALPSWLLGCVLANKHAGAKALKQHSSCGIFIWRISVAIVASLLYWLTMNTPVGFYLTMNPFAILIFFWLSAEISAQKDANSLFERMGKWSYSIYLFHAIFLVLLSKLAGKFLFISIPIILALCYLAYISIEKPSHEYARLLFRKYREQFQFVSTGNR
jgi:peptidoglycan/LPS O-acetylase OafA/YrhL